METTDVSVLTYQSLYNARGSTFAKNDFFKWTSLWHLFNQINVFQTIEPSNHVRNGNCHSVILSSPLMLMLICFTSDLCCRWCWSWRWRWSWCRWWRWRSPDRSSTALAAQRKDIGGVWRGLKVGWTCSTWPWRGWLVQRKWQFWSKVQSKQKCLKGALVFWKWKSNFCKYVEFSSNQWSGLFWKRS